jgi:hemoglobin
MSSKPTIDRRQTLKGMAAGAGAALAAGGQIPTSAAQGADEATPDAAEASLYERLGGYFAIAAVVDRFSDEIIKNPNCRGIRRGWRGDRPRIGLF